MALTQSKLTAQGQISIWAAVRRGLRFGPGSIFELDAKRRVIAVEMLVNHESITLQGPDVVVAALAHFRHKPSLGFSDCLVLEIARKSGYISPAGDI